MIEAVNSVISNAPLVRGNADQVDASRSYAANPDIAAQEAARAPQAPYISPYISLDVNYDKAVLLIRDSDTGDTLRQFPSETRLREIQRSENAAGGVFAQSQSSDVVGVQTTTTARTAPQVSDVHEFSAAPVAQAQQASAALVTASQSGVQNLSAGVSVQA